MYGCHSAALQATILVTGEMKVAFQCQKNKITDEMTRLHSDAKTTKSSNFFELTVTCQASHNTYKFHIYMANTVEL